MALVLAQASLASNTATVRFATPRWPRNPRLEWCAEGMQLEYRMPVKFQNGPLRLVGQNWSPSALTSAISRDILSNGFQRSRLALGTSHYEQQADYKYDSSRLSSLLSRILSLMVSSEYPQARKKNTLQATRLGNEVHARAGRQNAPVRLCHSAPEACSVASLATGVPGWVFLIVPSTAAWWLASPNPIGDVIN